MPARDVNLFRLPFALFLLLVATHLAGAAELDTRPLKIPVEPVFTNIEWVGWRIDDDDFVPPLRPILVTHAGDESNRLFVPTQRGVIYVFPNDPATKRAEVFLDISSKVSYSDKENEEGFLGMAFHPEYSKNGRFFVYYTNKDRPHRNVVAAYQVSGNDPNRADRRSEEQLMVIDKPFWNHDGGTICFGPDGNLYIAIGDGGKANDPFRNGQKLSTLLAKILRIDVDHRDKGLAYAIPRDNPFVNRTDARPEIWAYGLRNVWRMAFDPKTDVLWAADVGQDTWEEIDLIERGGNYGWNLREGRHAFGKNGSPARKDLIEPIWEYDHKVGKSITGGLVYRGRKLPELEGYYLYADYVTGRLWALRYDLEQQRVVANREIPLPQPIPVMSFGSDQDGEIYLTTFSANGRGIFKIGGE